MDLSKRAFPEPPRDAQDVNPFLVIWLKRALPGRYYCPNNEIAQDVIEYFETTAKDMRVKPSNTLVQAFLDFWNLDKIRQHGITAADKAVTSDGVQIDITWSQRAVFSGKDRFVTELDGWLSLDHLNTCLTRDLKGWLNTLDTNPFFGAFYRQGFFRQNKTYTFPDFETLPALYELLGIQSSKDLALREGDLVALETICTQTKFDDVLQARDGIHAVEVRDYWTDELRMPKGVVLIFTNAPVVNFVKQLASMLENRKNPKGFQGGADVFQAIAEGRISGKQLGRHCMADKKMLAFCTNDDYAVFRRALVREFEIIWEPGIYGHKNARDLYGRMHTGYFYFIPGLELAVYVVSGRAPPKGAILVVPNAADPKVEPEEDYFDHEKFVFLYNAVSPSFSFVLDSDSKQMFGTGVLIESLGDSAQQFVDEVEDRWQDVWEGNGHTFVSHVAEIAFGDQEMATFMLVEVARKG